MGSEIKKKIGNTISKQLYDGFDPVFGFYV